MNKIVRAAAAALAAAFALCAQPALAQFAAQQTYVSSSSGAANAFAVTVPNINQASDLIGVPIRVLMSASNSGAATLSVSNGVSTVMSNVAINKPTTSGLSALVGNEIRSGQISTYIYDGTVLELQSPTLNLATTQSQSGFTVATNMQINATVNSNQLTIALKAATTGGDPSSASPVYIPFRDTTIANGDPVWLGLTSALSFTIGSGSTMGCVSAKMCRLWIVAINNGGTPALCAYNALSGTNIVGINEAVLQSSGAGTSGGNSAQTYYCSASSVASKAVRILGYVDIQQVTAGTWSSGPTYVQLFGPGVAKPGEILQEVYAQTGANGSTANAYPLSNTPPGISDGGAAINQAVTIQSGANVVQIDAQAIVGIGSGSPTSMVAYILDGSTNVATSIGINTSGGSQTIPVGYRASGIAGSKTYSLYYSAASSGAAVNGTSGVPLLGGTGSTFIRIKEIMGSLAPANDDASLEMTG